MNIAPDKIHKLARLGVIAAYIVAIEWISVRTGSPADSWWWLNDIPFFLWIVAPVAVPLLLPVRHWLLTAGVTALAVCGVYLYEDAMFGPDTRSTSALVFVFLPLYQWVGTAILIVLASVMSRRKAQ